MKPFLAIFLSVILVFGVLSGCEKMEGPKEPTIGGFTPTDPTEKPQEDMPIDAEMSLVYNPEAPINPFQCTDSINRTLFTLMYQGLFTVDADYQAYPILCDTYNVSADMKTYTFHLAANALFSDGVHITAQDVVASLEAAKGSPWYGGRLQHVQTISAYGSTVVLELSTPMENLPILLDIPVVKASQVAISNPIGSGPYRLEITANGAWLQRQAAWWSPAQLPIEGDAIALVPATSTAELQNAFRFDNAGMVSAGADAYVDFRGDYELWDCENGLFLYMVCHEKSEIFKNPELRQALTYAIDRELLVETYYHGFATEAQLPASPESPWYTEKLAQNYGYDPQKFADAVAAANLESKEVTLLLNGDDITRTRVGQAIKSMLEAGGLKVTITTSTAENLEESLKKATYDLYLGQTRLSPNMDLSAFFGTNTSLNYGGLADPSLYALSLEALANAGNYYKLHEMVMEEGQLCPILFQHNAIYTQRGAFPELSPARDNIFFYDLGRTLSDAHINQD